MNRTLLIRAIQSLGPNAYGGAIQEMLNEWGYDVSLGAIYVALGILEKDGIVKSREEPGGPERGGKPKICYEFVN